MKSLLLLAVLIPPMCRALTGYDCEKGPLNIGLLDLRYTTECANPTFPTANCDLLKRLLTAVKIAPDQFAFDLMQGPGHMVATAENLLYTIRCLPVECETRSTNECLSALPVTCGNESLFLTPISKIIARRENKNACNLVLPTRYLIDDKWYNFTLTPTEVLPFKTGTPLTWKQCAVKKAAKFIDGFMAFSSSLWTAMVGIFVTVCILKFIVDTMRYEVKLYRGYGLSWRLIEAPRFAYTDLKSFSDRILGFQGQEKAAKALEHVE